jgi:hypothetical protein
MKILALIASLALASAQSPPVWPKEFTSNITETDLYRNATRTYFEEYSVSNNGVQYDFTDYVHNAQNLINDYEDYNGHRDYFVVTPANGKAFCTPRPLDGNIFVPPVATFTYNGTEQANTPPGNWPVTTYRFLGRIARDGDFVYHTTADTNENPVGYFDFTRGIKTLFVNLNILTPSQWPSGTWTPNSACSNRTRTA